MNSLLIVQDMCENDSSKLKRSPTLELSIDCIIVERVGARFSFWNRSSRHATLFLFLFEDCA
jgi:hypothetical protein